MESSSINPDLERLDIEELTAPRPAKTLKVLILGSYDKQTKDLMEKLTEEIKRIYDYRFEGKLVAVLVENVRIFRSRTQNDRIYVLITEKYGRKQVLSLFKDGRGLDVFEAGAREALEYETKIVSTISESKEFREIFVTSKVRSLSEWADLIPVVKERSLTRGGELIELSVLTCMKLFNAADYTPKIMLLQRKGVKLSWMADELVKLGGMRSASMYQDFSSLMEVVVRQLDLILEQQGFKSS